MKFIALGCLLMLFGFIAGIFVAPQAAPVEPIVFDGVEQPVCGLSVLSTMFIGGIIGGTIGLFVGVFIAWFLPTPLENRVSTYDYV